MPTLFLELFSEEIPARMQARAAEDLARLAAEALAGLTPANPRAYAGPRRIALTLDVAEGVAENRTSERGPRISAPEAALAGFLRKHGAARADLRAEGDFFVLDRTAPGASAATVIAAALPPLLWRFPWPKSMRWGGTSAFTWVRPLRRIVCLLDGAVVPFALAQGEDDAHGLASGDLTEGHRFLASGPFFVRSAEHWAAELRARFVLVDAAERRAAIKDGLAALAAAEGLSVVDDPGLLDEVTGLVEWPVPLLGRIDAAFMELPPPVTHLSMRLNQRYFALEGPDHADVARFGFISNMSTTDGGSAIIAGNERVLRARLDDARHFWDTDRRTPLPDRLDALKAITFHARIGTQFERVARVEALAAAIAPWVGADPALAARAARLAKADLTTGMVGEFPELQGVMGGYYARHDGEPKAVADAVADHYAPRGAADPVPDAPVTLAVSLADKLDTLAGFFRIGETPTGSGDPYALRRAGLGVIRILRDRSLRIGLRTLLRLAGADDAVAAELLAFLAERLRVQLRAEGARHDVLSAVLATPDAGDDVVRLLARVDAVAGFLATPDGRDLLAASKRAANILRIEDRRDGPHTGTTDPSLFRQNEERILATTLDTASARIETALAAEKDSDAMATMAGLRAPLDAFFAAVTVNATEPEIRLNRLRLLAHLRATLDRVADFSMIDG